MAAGESVIDIRGLTKVFGQRRSVDGLDLAVRRGEIFGFLGPNGAGKSTTIRMLLGLITPTGGEATIAGKSIRRERGEALRHLGGIIEAPCFHDHLSARKNLELAQRLQGLGDKGRIDELAEMVDLKGRLDDPVGIFSHGMRQRLGLARAILHRPDVVILDEPADGLDPRGRRQMRDIILDVSRRLSITVFLSSHLLNEMEVLCGRVGIINQGRLLYQGEVEALRARYSGASGRQRLVVARPEAAADLLAGRAGGRALCSAVEPADDGALIVTLAEGVPAEQVWRAVLDAGLGLSEAGPARESLEDLFLRLTPGPGN